MEITMYDTLLQLPLFQGLCKNDFTSILGKVKLHFRKYNADEIIVEQGEPCTELIFLLNGEISSQIVDEQKSYSLHETFGSTDLNLVSIDKAFVLSELNNYEIFRLNYLNILSNRAQIAYNKLWNSYIGSPKEKIINFILSRSMRPEGEKRLKIKMEDLAGLIDETRINVSKELNDMQEKGLVELSRKEIFIPAMEKLSE